MIDAAQLRHHRTLAGLSQRKLAILAGLGPLGIQRLEAGSDASRLPLKVVARIAAALDTSVDQLLHVTKAAAPPTTSDPADAFTPPTALNANQARLLRRLHRGEDIRRTLTKADRELTLPSLLRAGVVAHNAAQPALVPAVLASLATPDTAQAATNE